MKLKVKTSVMVLNSGATEIRTYRRSPEIIAIAVLVTP